MRRKLIVIGIASRIIPPHVIIRGRFRFFSVGWSCRGFFGRRSTSSRITRNVRFLTSIRLGISLLRLDTRAVTTVCFRLVKPNSLSSFLAFSVASIRKRISFRTWHTQPHQIQFHQLVIYIRQHILTFP